MQALTQGLGGSESLRARALAWRNAASVSTCLVLSFAMACLTGILAQVRFPLPTTPVPVTGQVFGVLLAGALLGSSYGALSQALYVAIGAAGLTWFNGLAGGWGVLSGVTGGYLLGFIPAAALTGYVTNRLPRLQEHPLLMCLPMLGGVAIIYLCGAVQFAAFTHTGLRGTLAMAVVPFIPLDIAKAFLAAAFATAILPGRIESAQ